MSILKLTKYLFLTFSLTCFSILCYSSSVTDLSIFESEDETPKGIIVPIKNACTVFGTSHVALKHGNQNFICLGSNPCAATSFDSNNPYIKWELKSHDNDSFLVDIFWSFETNKSNDLDVTLKIKNPLLAFNNLLFVHHNFSMASMGNLQDIILDGCKIYATTASFRDLDRTDLLSIKKCEFFVCNPEGNAYHLTKKKHNTNSTELSIRDDKAIKTCSLGEVFDIEKPNMLTLINSNRSKAYILKELEESTITIENNEYLKELYLCNNSFENCNIQINNNPNLKKIVLKDNRFSSFIRKIEKGKVIQSVYSISEDKNENLTEILLESIPDNLKINLLIDTLKKLQTLEIINSPSIIQNLDLNDYPFENIQKLSLKNNDLSEKTIISIFSNKKIQNNLKQLDLSGNPEAACLFNTELNSDMPIIAKLLNLNYLNLSNCKIGYIDITKLSSSYHTAEKNLYFQYLTYLNLSKNNLGRLSVKTLLSLIQHGFFKECLKEIDLSDNDIYAKGDITNSFLDLVETFYCLGVELNLFDSLAKDEETEDYVDQCKDLNTLSIREYFIPLIEDGTIKSAALKNALDEVEDDIEDYREFTQELEKEKYFGRDKSFLRLSFKRPEEHAVESTSKSLELEKVHEDYRVAEQVSTDVDYSLYEELQKSLETIN